MKKMKPFLLGTVVVLALAGCSNKNIGTTESMENVMETVEAYTEKEIIDMITGLKDWYIVENSKNIDLMDGVISKSKVIKKIEVDDSNVDYTKVGTYKIIYSIKVDAYIMDDSEAKSEPEIETEMIREETSPEETNPSVIDNLTVRVKREVHVITSEEGEKLADQGKEVLTSDNKVIANSNKKETESTGKEKKVADNQNKMENKSKTTSGNSTNKANVTNNSSSAPSSGTSSKPGTSTPNTSTPAPSGGMSSKPNASTPSTTAPSTPQTEAPEPARPQTPETTHVHNWVKQTHTVHHDATGHYEDVVTQDAWDEPVYDMVLHWYCNTCGDDITENVDEHMDDTMHGGYHSNYEPVQTGTIHHEAVTESQWVEDTAAWTETIIDGYRCSGCGAMK